MWERGWSFIKKARNHHLTFHYCSLVLNELRMELTVALECIEADAVKTAQAVCVLS